MRLIKPTLKTLDLGDGDNITVVADISKRTFNDLVASMPQDVDQDKGMTPKQGTEFQSAVFSAFVKGWTVQDEQGKDLPVDVQTYLDLPNEFASKIDNALMEHFNSITVSPEESKEPATSPAK